MKINSKLLWIVGSIILVIIILSLIFGLVFTIKQVKVNLLKTSDGITNEQIYEVVKDKKVSPYGDSVFFFNRTSAKNKIEKAVPEIKVINLEVQFPNVLRINCEQRHTVFSLELKNSTYNYAIIDEDFKVIDTTMSNTNFVNIRFYENDLESDTIYFDNPAKGDFLNDTEINFLKKLFNLQKAYGITESVLKEHFSSIDVYYRNKIDGKVLCVMFNSNQGYEIDIREVKVNTENKIVKMLNIMSNSDISGKQIIETEN